MKCPKCGAENPAENKFCGACGVNLKEISDQDRINILKKEIPESLVQKILLTKDSIEKERKDVTVIFTDISGFTSMSEKLDPEELTLLMNDCFRKLGAMIYRYEGIIDKFIGDCIMAIFGAPITHEDDPERAILACLDMQNALNEVNQNLDPSLEKLTIHSGINTGEVIAGKVGSDLQMDYTVMGDTVNVAQRLKDIAPSSSILTGSETYNRTRHAFDFMTMEPVRLKGKAEQVRPYEVIGRKWGSEFGSGALHSDLIGREQESTSLKNGYEDLIKGKSSLYIIKGEIGVGKSRLLYEFKKFLTMSAPDIVLIDGHGVSYERTVPLKSFADCLCRMLSEASHTVAGISERILKKKIEDLLGQESPAIAPYLYKLFNIPLDKTQEEKVRYLDSHALQLQIFLAVATLFEKITKQKPILFIMDDIQWLDSTSIELLNFLLPMLKKNNISFYLSYRVGNILSIKNLLQSVKKDFQDILIDVELKNLNPAGSSLLIDNLIGQEIPELVREYIVTKSGGNPFFIEEIVRRVLESGMLSKKEKITVDSLQIPGSIDAAVTSRIDSLDKEAKYLLKIASIIGRSFPQKLLEEVIKEKDVYQHIENLEMTEFLVKINKNKTIHYAFRHPLFQEVAYNSLLKSERTIYHQVIAETIEQKFEKEIEGFYATLAYHYYNCKNKEKTLEYSLKAGDEAAALYANDDALLYYKQALSVVENAAEKTTILEKIGDIELMIGDIANATRHLDQARETAPDKTQEAHIISRVAKVLEQTGKIDESIDIMRKAICMIEDTRSTAYVELHYYLSNILIESKAEIEEAMILVDKGLEVAKKINDKAQQAEGLRAKAHILWRKGKNEETLGLLKQARFMYEEIGEVKVMPFLYLLMAATYRALGNIDAAIEYVKKAIDISMKIGNKRPLAMSYNNLGAYYAFIGDYQSSLDFTEKNVVIRKQIGDKKGEGIGLMNIGVSLRYLGKYDDIMGYFEQAKDLFESIGEVRSVLTVYGLIANLLMNQDQPVKALKYFKKSLDIAEKTQDQALVGEALYRYGGYFQDMGEFKKARAYYAKAEPFLRDSADKYMLSELYSSLADISITTKDKEAIKYAEQSLKLAVDIKMKSSEIRALRVFGRVQAITGNNVTEGIKNIKRSIAIAKEVNARDQLAHSLYALAEVLIAENKPAQAKDYLNKAQDLFKEFDAKLWLKQVAALMDKIS